MRFIAVSTFAVRFAVAVNCALVIAFVTSGFSGARELSSSEMKLSRGSSTEVCKKTQSCDEYNHYFGFCIGKANGTACTTCSQAANNITYLGMADGLCNPPPPGFKYNGNPPVTCGNQSIAGTCKNNACQAVFFNRNTPCTQPDLIVNQ